MENAVLNFEGKEYKGSKAIAQYAFERLTLLISVRNEIADFKEALEVHDSLQELIEFYQDMLMQHLGYLVSPESV